MQGGEGCLCMLPLRINNPCLLVAKKQNVNKIKGGKKTVQVSNLLKIWLPSIANLIRK